MASDTRLPGDEPAASSTAIDADEAARIAFATHIIETQFAQVHDGGRVSVERVASDYIRVRLDHHASQIRPGGTISGPTMFKLADVCVYVGVLGARGDAGVQAVTTSMSMNFLRRPKPGDLIAEGRMLKLGRRLAIGDVHLFSAADRTLVAQATATYALPS